MSQPNVVVILCDQMRATASHLYWQDSCPTPNLERLAGEGVLFRHAFTPHPLCMPARVSLWTSQYTHTHGARRNETPMPSGVRHAFRIWREEGYDVSLIGKNHCFADQDDFALFSDWCEISHMGIPRDAVARGAEWFRPLDAIHAAHGVRRDMPWDHPKVAYAAAEHNLDDTSTGLVTGQTLRFLEERSRDTSDQPFALWVSYPDPHEPYETPQSYLDQIRDVVLPPWDAASLETMPEVNRVLHRMLGLGEDELDVLQAAMRVYYANVRFIDDSLGRIMDTLDATGLSEDTIVVFCSDHGDFMGEHRMTCKGGVFYDSLTRVPLILRWPGQISAGIVDESMANLIDIVPTLFNLQEIEIPAEMQGLPLPTVTDTAPRDAVFSEYGAGGRLFGMNDLEAAPRPFGYHTLLQSLQWREAAGRRKMVRTQDYKYVHDSMGDRDELYDLVEDPWELHNLAEETAHRPALHEMQRRLMDWAIDQEDPGPVPLPDCSLRLT